jgi:hypothetical protein
MRPMLFKRRARADVLAELQSEVQTQAALAIVAEHAEAGRRAQAEGTQLAWSQRNSWSQPTEPKPAPEPVAPSTITIPAELLRVLDAVTSMCDHVIEYIEADRAERPLMIEALSRLNRSLAEREIAGSNGTNGMHGPVALEEHRAAALEEHVVAGSLEAGPEPIIDLTDAERAEETAVEVRCRFGDRWVDGFEICEALHEEAGVRYRLRRRVDGVVLPDLFGAADIRHIETFEQLTSVPHQPRHWSPL